MVLRQTLVVDNSFQFRYHLAMFEASITTDLYALKVWLQDHFISVEIKKHKITEELEAKIDEIKKYMNEEQIQDMLKLSPDQLIATGEFGEISVIRGHVSMGLFEIFCLKGDLFGGIRRYNLVSDTGKTIKSLLETGMFDETVKRAFDIWTDFVDANPDGSVQDVDPPDIM